MLQVFCLFVCFVLFLSRTFPFLKKVALIHTLACQVLKQFVKGTPRPCHKIYRVKKTGTEFVPSFQTAIQSSFALTDLGNN